MGAGRGNVVVNTQSPSGLEKSCKVEERDAKYYAKILPTEVGEWITTVHYDYEEVNGSPNIVDVFDPKLADIIGLNKMPKYQINRQIAFQSESNKNKQNNPQTYFKTHILHSFFFLKLTSLKLATAN